MSWFRWHIGTAVDAKFHITARNASVTVRDVIAVWALILEDAASMDHRGICTRDMGYLKIMLDLDQELLEQILAGMEELELISFVDQQIIITNWDKRQFESDITDPTNAERQRRYRNRKRNGAVTDDNGTLRTKAANNTPEADTDTDKKERSCSNEFELFWKAYPRRVGKKVAEKALAKALKETSIETIAEALARQTPLWTDPKFIPHPATWLNAGRWADDVGSADGTPRRVYTPEEIEAGRAWYRRKQAEAAE